MKPLNAPSSCPSPAPSPWVCELAGDYLDDLHAGRKGTISMYRALCTCEEERCQFDVIALMSDLLILSATTNQASEAVTKSE